MRLSSSTSDPAAGLFGGIYSTPAADAATGDLGWLQAMLDTERALALGAARVGLVDARQAAQVAAACTAEGFDAATIGRSAATNATPVIALVAALRSRLPASAAPAVHVAATSQDILDTAAALVARRALGPALADAAGAAALLAGLARRHRDTPQVGRSLLQHGELTTFGAACAARLAGVAEAAERLAAVRGHRLAVQLGGAVGTLASAGGHGEALVTAVAAELGLAEPVLPWHTSRGRVAELACAIGILSGELAAAAQDVVLLSATELGEVAVAAPGGSSAMPHKRNPSAAVLAVACAHRIPGLVATVLAAMPQELQRSPGRWQAEWGTLNDLLRLLAATAHHTRTALDGLEVDVARMDEHVQQFRSAVPSAGSTGSAGAFVDRALAAYGPATEPRPAGSDESDGTGDTSRRSGR